VAVTEKFEQYSIEYGYGREGARWCMDVMATSPQDALDRLKAAASFGKVSGVVNMTLPAAQGAWLPRLIVAVANLFRRHH
jgi:hypothetical protein